MSIVKLPHDKKEIWSDSDISSMDKYKEYYGQSLWEMRKF